MEERPYKCHMCVVNLFIPFCHQSFSFLFSRKLSDMLYVFLVLFIKMSSDILFMLVLLVLEVVKNIRVNKHLEYNKREHQ